MVSSANKQAAGMVKLVKSTISLAKDVHKTSKAVVQKQGPKARACDRCAAPAQTYCVECKQSLCKFCVAQLHHPTTKLEKHSIEEIKTKDDGVQIITPILLDLLIAAGVALLVYEAPSMEWQVENFCPCIGRARRIIAWVDMNVFYWYKREFAAACNVEDSFWRLLVDTWVRGFVTGSDSVLLIFSTLGAAFIFEEAVRMILAPVLGVVYACLAIFARWAERHITLKYLTDHKEAIEKFEAGVARVAFSRFFAPEGKPPPLTFPRRRPYTDQYEQVMYHWERQMRSFQYYKGHAQAIVNYMLRSVVFFSALVRVICMVVPLSSLVRVTLGAIGFQSMLDRHADNFQGATGIYHQESAPTDWMFMFTARSLLRQVPGMRSMGESFLTDAFNFSIAVLRVPLFVILLIIYGLYRLARWRLRKYLEVQRKDFDKKWKAAGGTCFQIWGVDLPENAKALESWRQQGGGCGRVEWSTRVFRKVGAPAENGSSSASG